MPLPLQVEIAFENSPEAIRLRWREELRRVEGVQEAGFAPARHECNRPSGRDGGALDFGKLLLTVVPDAVKTVLNAIVAYGKRPGAPPAKIKVKTADGAIEMEFSARDLTPELLASAAERLTAALRAGH
jgi:hypothetical protein